MVRRPYPTNREQTQEGFEDYLLGIESKYEERLDLTHEERILMLERNTLDKFHDEGGELLGLM